MSTTADITVLGSRLGAAHDILARWHSHELRQQSRLERIKLETGARRVTVELDPLDATRRYRAAYVASFYHDDDQRPDVQDDSGDFATPNFNAELRVLAAQIVNQHRRCLARGFGDPTTHANAISHWQVVGRRAATSNHEQAVRMVGEAAKFSQAVVDASKRANRMRKAA